MTTLHLPNSARAWASDSFTATLKRELEALGSTALPLQAALAHSSYVTDEPIRAIVQRIDSHEDHVMARIGLFFSGVIAGCSCADDPTPLESLNEYAEFDLCLHLASGQATIQPTAE